MANVLGVIGARLNSSRLPGKHLLDLAGKPLIARLFERLEQVEQIDQLVLATTCDYYNQPLLEWADSTGKAAFAYDGDVDDVVGRVNAAVEKYQADIVVYICGDSPLIEPTTVGAMIDALLVDPSAGYVVLDNRGAGAEVIHEGFYPYPRATWNEIVRQSQSKDEREHVGASLKKFVEDLKTVTAYDQPVYSKLQHRISVDTVSDYKFMHEVYRRWYAAHPADSIVSLAWVIEVLTLDADLLAINAEVKQRAVGEVNPAVIILTQCDGTTGLGHLRRMTVLAGILQDTLSAGLEIVIVGEPVTDSELGLLPHRFLPLDKAPDESLATLLDEAKLDALIVDLPLDKCVFDIKVLLKKLKGEGTKLVAVDGFLEQAALFDLIYIPSFYLDEKYHSLVESGKVIYGWDKYLLRKGNGTPSWLEGNKVLVLTGGGDLYRLGDLWPELLDQTLPQESEVHWVRGPYAEAPQIPENSRLDWSVHHAPEDMLALMESCNYAVSQYGIAVFELMQSGVPTVVLSHGEGMQGEMKALAESGAGVVCDTPQQAADALARLMAAPDEAQKLSERVQELMLHSDGPMELVNRLRQVVAGEG